MRKHHALVACCPSRQLLFTSVDDRTATTYPAGSDTKPHPLSSFGTSGHDILALRHDLARDALYTLGSDHALRAWNFKTGEQKWAARDRAANSGGQGGRPPPLQPPCGPLTAPRPDDCYPPPIAFARDLMEVTHLRPPWLSGSYHPRRGT
jgi:hypothetical protein